MVKTFQFDHCVGLITSEKQACGYEQYTVLTALFLTLNRNKELGGGGGGGNFLHLPHTVLRTSPFTRVTVRQVVQVKKANSRDS